MYKKSIGILILILVIVSIFQGVTGKLSKNIVQNIYEDNFFNQSPIDDALEFYFNCFSTNPNLQGNNDRYKKVDWDLINKRINWAGGSESEQIDRYFTFSGINMNEPVFRCDFCVNTLTSSDQKWSLINYFRLEKINGIFIGFGHVIDKYYICNGKSGIRGEFYSGKNKYYTPCIYINNQESYTINVFIENGKGKIKIGQVVQSIPISGNFSGIYNSFHFQFGDVPSASDNIGSAGWFDNLLVSKPDDFIIPEWGGAMIHSDTHLSDYINLSAPINNVDIVWQKNSISGERSGTKGNGIAGNKKIAVCPFGNLFNKNNLVIYDYNGNYLWKSDDLLNGFSQVSTPMVDKYNRVIACDNKYILMIDPDYNKNGEYVWKSPLSSNALPLSPTLTDNGVIILPTFRGPLYAFDIRDGACIETKYFEESYSSENSVCVNGNRIYILTSKPVLFKSKLYAIDVDPDSNQKLSIAWSYSFDGKSQASPTFIDGVIYFDVYQAFGVNPEVLAVIDMGTYGKYKWKKDLDHRTLFSMSYDPRGGVWYEDHAGRKLVRLDTNNGDILDEIVMDELIGERDYIPMSVMEVCGNVTNPIMIISANKFFKKYYVCAIDLTDNSLIWKVEINSLFKWNYAGGQYTILMDENGNNPRIVFGSYWDGVIAIGEFS